MGSVKNKIERPQSAHAMREVAQLDKIGEVRSKLNHKVDRINLGYLSITHLLTALFFIPIVYAPSGLLKVMFIYLLIHLFFALISTTAYAHRLISHSATRQVNLLVHLVFGYFGQTLAAQGSLASWAGKHRVHHAVDGNQNHDQDPYSAVWFTSAWRNFLWSHVLCYCFESPHENGIFKKRTESILRQHGAMRLQHNYYVVFLIIITKILPFLIGYIVGGSMWAGLCVLWTSIVAIVCSQNITWSVNSVTHMWGVSAARSSAKNNYIWLLPLGEGNHHADHHDAPTDYRNGFGFLGWLLDPTRYILLGLRALRLIGPLQRTSRSTELKLITDRKLQRLSRKKDDFYKKFNRQMARRLLTNAQDVSSEKLETAKVRLTELWEHYDHSLESLKVELYRRAQTLDQLKRQQSQLIAKRSQYTKEQLESLLTEIKIQLKAAKNELRKEWRLFSAEVKAAKASLNYQYLMN